MADQTRLARTEAAPAPAAPLRPPRFNSLVAAAEVMTRTGRVPGGIDRTKVMAVEKWQEESWDHYDRCGEFRSGVNWLSNALSRVNLVAARPPQVPGDEPGIISLDDEGITPAERRAVELVAAMANGSVGQGQMMAAFGQHLSIAGIGWLIAEPDLEDPEADEYLAWNVLASDCVKKRAAAPGESEGVWQVRIESSAWRDAHPNALIVKCWRKHPHRPWEPDAPVRASLTILNQLDTLTLGITATAVSRLAGAGLLAIPSEFTFPPAQITPPENEPPDPPDQIADPDPADLFIETLIDSMVIPIKDRGTAAAVVPLVIQVPGEYLSKIQWISFVQANDDLVLAKIELAVRRLALGMDMPPEVLLGTADVNHWNMWQVAETAITLHIEPNAEIVCHALTEGFLDPALESERLDPGVAMVWYDTTDLATRPDKSAVTTDAYDRIEASGDAFRREVGLSDEDKPDDDEKRERVLLKAMELAPALVPIVLAELGYLNAENAAAAVDAMKPPDPEPVAPGEPGEPSPVEQTPPEEPADPGEAPARAAAALLAACDGIVWRALERSGQRLRSAAGKRVTGGAETIECDDPTRLHLTLDATIYADLDHLLDGAWARVPEVASRYGVDPASLAASLTAYCRALLAAGHPHSIDRLAVALGVEHHVLV